MQKFWVVSYDEDQDQWFYDIVPARNKDDAKAKVIELRDYCYAADAFSMDELLKETKEVTSMSLAEVQKSWKRMVDNKKEVEKEVAADIAAAKKNQTKK